MPADVQVTGFDGLQSTEPVLSMAVLSLYVPMAVNDWLSPKGIDGLGGLIARDIRTGVVTLSIS